MSLIIFLAVCFFAGYSGSRYVVVSVKTWYPALKKPSWTPPERIFAPVWTLLYALMAVAAWMVWEKLPGASSRWPMLIFALQLLLNVAWSAIFFGLRNINMAFKEILALWAAVIIMVISFWEVDPLAGMLLVPYALWVSFAVYLNYTVCRMNR